MITQEQLKEYLHYNQETGDFTWVKRSSIQSPVNIGDLAGYKHPTGYLCLKILKHRYQAHVLAWLYMTGEFPTKYIDHINRKRGDNRWVNLREASMADNLKNTSFQRNNKTGFKGVSFDIRSGKFRAVARMNGKQIALGLHKTLLDAAIAYDNYAIENHGEFYLPQPKLLALLSTDESKENA